MTEKADFLRRIEYVQLDTRFTDQARDRINEFLGSFESFEPTLGLLYGDVQAESKGSWSMVAYGRQTVDDIVEMYAAFGSVVCYDLDGIHAVIPQIAHIDELETAELEYVGGRLRPLPPQAS